MVGHRQAQLCALAVLQPKHILAHPSPAAGLFPHLARVQRGQVKLLANRVHFFADDRGDLVDGAVAEEEVRVEAGSKLANIACAKQKSVACDLRV